MSTHVHRIQASEASRFLATVTPTEDWQAGGAFGDILEDLKREGHIRDELYIAGFRLIHDMTRCHGHSGGLIGSYDDNPKGGRHERLPAVHVPDMDAFSRMDRVLGGLRGHERELLSYCVKSRDLARGGISDWGRQRSKYSTAKTQRAWTVGQIRSLLESIFELYTRSYHPG